MKIDEKEIIVMRARIRKEQSRELHRDSKIAARGEIVW